MLRNGRFLLGVLMSAGCAFGADDAALDGFIQAALRSNPGVQAMAYRVEASKQALRQARSAYLPRFNASATYMVTDNPPQSFMMMLHQRKLDMTDPSFDVNSPEDTENIRLSLGVKYRLYDGGRGSRTGGAKLGEVLAGAGRQAARNELIHGVTRGYYQVLEAQSFADVQEASLASLEESLRVARERFDSGSAVKTDVLNLEVQTAQAHENLIRARNGVQLSIAALNMAIGHSVVKEDGLPLPSLVPIEPETVMIDEDNLGGRPEYRISVFRVRAAELMLKAARGDRGPVLNAFGSVDWDSDDLSDQERSYMAGLALEWEWFSGFENAGKVAEAKQRLLVAEAERDQVRNELSLDLKQAVLAVQEGWSRLQVTSRSVGSAEEALRITREQYKEGAAEISVLLVAELGLTETRMRDTAAMYDYQIARSNLERATGVLVTRYSEETASVE